SEKAWRRPVTSEETDKLMALFQRGHERRDTFITSLRLALRGVLISPHFLFLAEPEPAQGGIHPLGAYPLASKLSYFLWSSMPDAQLISRAQDGTLLDTNVYRAEVRRMLKDPKARALGERFAIQWLDLDRLGTEIKPDPSRFPEFTEELKSDLLHEVVTASGHIFQNNRSLLEFIDSDYAFINQRLAKLYGIEGVEGSEFRQVKLSDRTRGGVIGMGAVHTVTSYPLRTSPVLRGRWVLESLLGEKVPPPPPDVPALDEKGTQHSPKSIREQLEIHRSKADCAACHDKMDPLGFGMENFDSLGRFRSSEAGQPIDTEGVLPSGKRFKGADGLKSVLMERKESVIRHMTRKMTGYAYGRELTKFDECVVNSTMAALSSNEYRSETLVESIAMSFPFRHRFYPKQN
ncbi:MAG: DUF1592 domain-containing protein, partial [Verrucomicrobia bacterium]|nr:DUF1592 domain-containing protein [Verrucomicrobiota bacterium]